MFLAREYEKLAAEYFGCRAVAPHGYVPYIIDEGVSSERELALEFGQKILDTCDAVAVFGDRISEGMLGEIVRAAKNGIDIYIYKDGAFQGVQNIGYIIRCERNRR